MQEKELIAQFIRNIRNEKARDAFENLKQVMHIKLENMKKEVSEELN